MSSLFPSNRWSGSDIQRRSDLVVENSSKYFRTSFNSKNSVASSPSDVFLDEPRRAYRLSSRFSATSNGSSRYSWRHSNPPHPNEQIYSHDERILYQDEPTSQTISTIEDRKEVVVEEIEKSKDVETVRGPLIDKCEWTRNLAFLGLLAVSIISFAAFSAGLSLVLAQNPSAPDFLLGKTVWIGTTVLEYYTGLSSPYTRGHWAYAVSKTSTVLIPLLLNLLLTAAFQAMGCIDATVLRWALWEESTNEQPAYQSNPRLFVKSKHHAPMSWYSNIISGVVLVFAYGSTALLTSPVQIIGITDASYLIKMAKPFNGPHEGLDFNGWALLFLGVCLFVQFFLTSWNMLWNPELVKTWSSSSLMSGVAGYQFPRKEMRNENNLSKQSCFATILRSHRETPTLNDLTSKRITASPFATHRNSRQNHEDEISACDNDLKCQPSMHTIMQSVRILKIAFWLLVVLFVTAVIAVSVKAARSQYTTAYSVYHHSLRTDFAAYWQWYGYINLPLVDNLLGSDTLSKPEWLLIVVQSLGQAPLTLALHFTSLIFDVSRDEATWRRTISKKGAFVGMDTFVDLALNWPSWALVIYKAVLQWIFGYAFSNTQAAVAISLIPLVVVTCLLVLLGITAEIISRRKPKGSLPATWGDIGKIACMIGELDGDIIRWNNGKLSAEWKYQSN